MTEFILPISADARVIDLGAGAGVMPIIIAAKTLTTHIVGVEIDPDMAGLARENVARNGLENRITVMNADLRALADVYPEGAFSVVISNPPYRKAGAGRPSPIEARETARAESATLTELLRVSRRLAGACGRIFYVYPVARLQEMLEECGAAALRPKRLRFMRAKADATAKFFMIELGAEGGLSIEETILTRREDGKA
ncbi:MAG: methyltransferase [Deltaproteobacteria bacterium]|nr:methyltransferase [Deltaproteobacteria bacterium]